MKKFLYIIGFLMFSSALFSPVLSRTVLGADAGTTGSGVGTGYDSGCTFPWITCGNMLNIPDKDWSATFGATDPEDVGQDLYATILEKTRVAPEQKAFANTASAFGSTQSDMQLLMNNNYKPILDKSPYLTQDQAIKKMREIQKRYQDEKETLDLQADIDASTMPNEIFENGDTSDSGFDLINDLNNIENILFKKMDPIDIGGNFDASSSGGSTTAGTQGGAGGQGTPSGPQGSTPGGGATGSSSSALTGGGTSGGTPGTGASTSGLGEKPSATDNPNICFGDEKLDKALQDFNDKKATDNHYKETPTKAASGTTGGTGTGTGTEEETGTTSSALTTTPSAPFTYSPPVTPPAAPAPAADWLKTPLCGDVLCITVDFVTKPASSYVDSDNCIACHVEKIDEKLKETINHSLIPGKATGNLLEPGICKQATADLFNEVGIRFYAVAKPVLTPTNDDLIYGTSMVDEWEKFTNTYKPFPFYEKKVPDPKDPKANTFLPTVEDSASKSAALYATPDTSISTVSNRVQQQLKTVQKNISQAVAVAEPAVQSDTDSSFYQSIRRELEQMNFYFDSFQNTLHSLHEKINADDPSTEFACDKLINGIKECT